MMTKKNEKKQKKIILEGVEEFVFHMVFQEHRPKTFLISLKKKKKN